MAKGQNRAYWIKKFTIAKLVLEKLEMKWSQNKYPRMVKGRTKPRQKRWNITWTIYKTCFNTFVAVKPLHLPEYTASATDRSPS